MKSVVIFVIFVIVAAANGASVESKTKINLTKENIANTTEDASPEKKLGLLPPGLNFLSKSWDWVKGTAGVIPRKCNFIYGGGRNRMLYVGRVRKGLNVFPAAIHHYGPGGTESVRYIQNGEVKVSNETEWLCANGLLGWARVENLSASTIHKSRPIPIGYNAASHSLIYGCLARSFYLKDYPPSMGTVKNGACIFEVDGMVVSTADFSWWHTLEILVAF